MELHKALQQIVSTNGRNILNNMQIINYLQDYQCFVDRPATKLIFRDIINSGYISELLVLNKSEAIWRTKFIHLVHDFIDSCGYKEELASYVFESIAYAIDLKISDKEPEVRRNINADSFFDISDENESNSEATSTPTPTPNTPKVDASDVYTIALSFFNDEKYSQAKVFIDKAINNVIKGNVPSDYYKLQGQILMKLGAFEDAIIAFNECLKYKSLELNLTMDNLRDALKKHEISNYENFIFYYFFCLFNDNRIGQEKWHKMLKKEARSGSLDAIQYCAQNSIDPIDEHVDIYFVDFDQLKSGDYLYEDGTFAHEYSESKKAICYVVLTETSDFEKSKGWTHGYLVSLYSARKSNNYLNLERNNYLIRNDSSYKWSCISENLKFPHSHYTIDDITHWDKTTKIKTEHLLFFNDYDKYPAFKSVKEFRVKMPIKSASSWFLPSVITLQEIFNRVSYPRIDWKGKEIWTSSQADIDNAVFFRENGYCPWIKIDSKQAEHLVVPICAF